MCLDDVLAGDELTGRAPAPQLLHGQAAHQGLVRRRALRPCTRQEAEEPVRRRAHL